MGTTYLLRALLPLTAACVLSLPPHAMAEGKGSPASGGAAGPVAELEWAPLPGGTFFMGSADEAIYTDAQPVHKVTVRPFEISKTLVTVEQYEQCVLQGACTAPRWHDNGCNWRRSVRRRHPINCVSWLQANQYAQFLSRKTKRTVRLPTEAEWEYAARSGGQQRRYPWGNQEPDSGLTGLGQKSTLPVCSRPAGNTLQGLCDMTGSVAQWVHDKYHRSYRGAPRDGSSFESDADIIPSGMPDPEEHGKPLRVTRGGAHGYADPVANFRNEQRHHYPPGTSKKGGESTIGFRLVRVLSERTKKKTAAE